MVSQKEAMKERGAEEKLQIIVDALAAHSEATTVRPDTFSLDEEEKAELASLLRLSERLDQEMEPRRAPAAFVRSLGDELVQEAGRRQAQRKRRHRIAVISAAVAGGVVSVASLVGGVVFLVKWLRTREARQPSAA